MSIPSLALIIKSIKWCAQGDSTWFIIMLATHCIIWHCVTFDSFTLWLEWRLFSPFPVSESTDIFAGLRVATCILTTHHEPDVSPCQIWAFPYAKPSLMQDVTFEIEHFDLAAKFSIELTLD